MRKTYQSDVKNEIRKRSWRHAVAYLTTRRREMTIVRESELLDSIRFSLARLGRFVATPSRAFVKQVETELVEWRALYKPLVRRRSASELRVLYLAGPEPQNDLSELVALGVLPSNIWAVESSRDAFEAAKQNALGARLKLFYGDLVDFVECHQEQFDLIYFDGTSHIASSSPNPLRPIVRILARGRLAPLSFLVTNFSLPAEADLDEFAAFAAGFWAARYRDVPPDLQREIDPATFSRELLREHFRAHPTAIYSDTVTRVVAALARSIIPNCRVLHTKRLREKFLAPTTEVSARIDAVRNRPKGAKDFSDLLPSIMAHGVPLFDFVSSLHIDAPNLTSALDEVDFRGLLEPAALLEAMLAMETDIASDHLREVLRLWHKTDPLARISCDSPMPRLLINSLLGVHGYPAHPATRATARWAYRSASTDMFLDCLALDHCRYYYDRLPAVAHPLHPFLIPAAQLVNRCMMDRLGWNDWSSDCHPFRAAAVPCMRDTRSAMPFDFPERIDLNSELARQQ